MKKLIIFEGIASSGKTTLEKSLNEHIEGSHIISEDETLMPLIDNIDAQVAINHLDRMLDLMDKSDASVIIVDRFHFTHCFRTHSNFSAFKRIEEKIRKHFDALIVSLQMDEDIIPLRIAETAERRGNGWVKGRQGTLDEKIDYYIGQQRKLAELIKETSIPAVVIVNTSDKDWRRCLGEIIRAIGAL